MAIRITIEDGENKVIHNVVNDDDCYPWPELFCPFIYCLRGLGYSIDEETERKIEEVIGGDK